MKNSEPTNSPGFLMADITRQMRRIFTQRLEQSGSGLTFAQAKALKFLSCNEGAKQKELADALEVQPMTMAKMLDQLAESGLIERQPDPNDRRAHRIHLTDKAQPQLEVVQNAICALSGEMFCDFSDEQTRVFIDNLNTLRDRLLTL